jgi:hypothetical protein
LGWDLGVCKGLLEIMGRFLGIDSFFFPFCFPF